jgi:hypothetical protein
MCGELNPLVEHGRTRINNPGTDIPQLPAERVTRAQLWQGREADNAFVAGKDHKVGANQNATKA